MTDANSNICMTDANSNICMTDANSNIRLRDGDDHFLSIFFIVKGTVNNEITVCIIYVYILILFTLRNIFF